MKRSLTAVSLVLAGLACAAAPAPGRQAEKVAHTHLKPGDMAPDFTLLDNKWQALKLSEFRGKKNVVLAFYVLAFTEG